MRSTIPFWGILAAILHCGCGGRTPEGAGNGQPLFGGTTKTYQNRANYVKPRSPEFRFISPAPGAVFRPRERFDSEVELVLPEGGRLPIFLNGGLAGNRNAQTTWQYLPKRKFDEKTYIYFTTFIAPGKPGRYQLWCEAYYSDRIAGITHDEDEPVEAKFRSNSVPVEVKTR